MVRIAFEVREEGRQLHGVVLQEGRASTGGRAEVFVPGSVTWPTEGIGILTEHQTEPEIRAFPHRDELGRINIRARITDAIREAIASGKRFMSVEFKAIEERQTRAGVREILRAFVTDAALVSNPEYDTTAAEIRSSAPYWHSDREALRWL